jgi:hypothetical protein
MLQMMKWLELILKDETIHPSLEMENKRILLDILRYLDYKRSFLDKYRELSRGK